MRPDTASHSSWSDIKIFAIVMTIGVGISAGFYVVSIDKLGGISSPAPRGYGPGVINSTTYMQPDQISVLSPLPVPLLGPVPQIYASYETMPFTGMQGSYCWAGGATTDQTTTYAKQMCVNVDRPNGITGVPTIAIYPNATLSFNIADQHTQIVSRSRCTRCTG